MPATTRENGPAPPPATNANSSSGGPGLRLAPLQARADHVERPAEARTELKDDRDRRKDDRETWNNGRGHGLNGGGAPSALESVNRNDRTRKRRLSITGLLSEDQN